MIPLLWRAQEQNDNWVSKPVIEYVADMLDMSYIRVLEVATFYTMFQLQPVGKIAHIQVCGTTPCMLRGAEDLKKVCQNRIHHDPHHLSADGKFSWEEVECLGACVNAPMVQIFKDTYEDLTPATLRTADRRSGRRPQGEGGTADRPPPCGARRRADHADRAGLLCRNAQLHASRAATAACGGCTRAGCCCYRACCAGTGREACRSQARRGSRAGRRARRRRSP